MPDASSQYLNSYQQLYGSNGQDQQSTSGSGTSAASSSTTSSSTSAAALAAAAAQAYYGNTSFNGAGNPSSAAGRYQSSHKVDYNNYFGPYMSYYGNHPQSGYGAYGAAAGVGVAGTAAGAHHQTPGAGPLYQLSGLPPPASLTDGANAVDADVLKTPGRKNRVFMMLLIFASS